jgi:hypothetical protein
VKNRLEIEFRCAQRLRSSQRSRPDGEPTRGSPSELGAHVGQDVAERTKGAHPTMLAAPHSTPGRPPTSPSSGRSALLAPPSPDRKFDEQHVAESRGGDRLSVSAVGAIVGATRSGMGWHGRAAADGPRRKRPARTIRDDRRRQYKVSFSGVEAGWHYARSRRPKRSVLGARSGGREPRRPSGRSRGRSGRRRSESSPRCGVRVVPTRF